MYCYYAIRRSDGEGLSRVEMNSTLLASSTSIIEDCLEEVERDLLYSVAEVICAGSCCIVYHIKTHTGLLQTRRRILSEGFADFWCLKSIERRQRGTCSHLLPQGTNQIALEIDQGSKDPEGGRAAEAIGRSPQDVISCRTSSP